MSTHFTYFEVKNFKKFNHLILDDIGQFNLITGDNNVGKTCLLEALLADENIDKLIENIHHSLCKRSIHIHPQNIKSREPIFPQLNYFDYLKSEQNKKISFRFNTLANKYYYELEDKIIEELNESDFEKEQKHNYNIGRPNLWIKIFLNEIFEELQVMYLDDFKTKFDHGYIPFINKNAGFSTDINHYFAETVGLEEGEGLKILNFSKFELNSKFKVLSAEDEQIFIENLSLFFNDIEFVRIKKFTERGDEILSIKLKRYNDYVPITQFGDGTQDFIRYILEIPKCKNKKLMIDEIASGIHFSKLKGMWKVIFTIAKKNNVQIFATTHSKEHIQEFVNAANEMKELMNDIRLIELEEFENDDKQIISKAETKRLERIELGLEVGENLLGGNVWK